MPSQLAITSLNPRPSMTGWGYSQTILLHHEYQHPPLPLPPPQPPPPPHPHPPPPPQPPPLPHPHPPPHPHPQPPPHPHPHPHPHPQPQRRPQSYLSHCEVVMNEAGGGEHSVVLDIRGVELFAQVRRQSRRRNTMVTACKACVMFCWYSWM
eukprot:392027-Hanusia_phi.AAC.1